MLSRSGAEMDASCFCSQSKAICFTSLLAGWVFPEAKRVAAAANAEDVFPAASRLPTMLRFCAVLSSPVPSCCNSKRITFSSKSGELDNLSTRFVYSSRFSAAAAAACLGVGVVRAGGVGFGAVGFGVVGVVGACCRGRNMGFM